MQILPENFQATSSTLQPGGRQLTFVLGLAILLVFTAIFLVGFTSEESIATVNGEEILKKDYVRRLAVQRYFYTNINRTPQKLETLERDELEFLIRLKLLEQFLKKHGRLVSEKEITDAIEKNYKLGNLTKEEYENRLATVYHQKIEDVKPNFKEELLIKKILGSRPKKHLLAIWLDRKSPKEETDDISEGWGVIEENLPAEEKPVWELAKKINQSVKEGEDFLKLAQRYSQYLTQGKPIGDLGFIDENYNPYKPVSPRGVSPIDVPKEQFPVPALVIYAYENLNNGEIALYNYPTGFAIFKVQEVRGGEDALVKNEDFHDWYANLRQMANVKIFINFQ